MPLAPQMWYFHNLGLYAHYIGGLETHTLTHAHAHAHAFARAQTHKHRAEVG